jgi:hypothetical protein
VVWTLNHFLAELATYANVSTEGNTMSNFKDPKCPECGSDQLFYIEGRENHYPITVLKDDGMDVCGTLCESFTTGDSRFECDDCETEWSTRDDLLHAIKGSQDAK